MTSELPKTALSNLIVHQKGFAFKSRDYQESGFPVVRVSNFTNDSIDTRDLKYVNEKIAAESQKVTLKKDDVVIATVGSWPKNPASIVGNTVCVPPEMDGAFMNQNSVILRVKSESEIDQKYLFIALKSKLFSEYLVSKAQGSANQASITLSGIFSYEVEWPEGAVRESIVSIIDSMNQKIKLNTQTNQTLEAIAQAIFKSWFVDFEPVKAKMAVLEAGGTAEEAECAAMCAISGKDEAALTQLQTEQPDAYAELAQTAALFPSAMQDSELGEIPEGWQITKIAELAKKVSKGTTPSKNDISNAEDNEVIPFLKVRDITDSGEIARTNLDKIPKSIHCGALKRSVLEVNDILFSIAGTIGRVAVIEEDLNDCNCNQAIAFIRLKEPEIYLELCRLNLGGYRVQSEVASKVVQGVQANFSLTSLGEIQIINPTVNVLNKLNETICGIGVKQRLLLAENRRLSELRDFLLPKLLSGEIDLSQAVDMADEVSA